MEKQKKLFGSFNTYLLMLLPGLVIWTVFFLVPVIASLPLSLTNFNGISLKMDFVGFTNYAFLFTDQMFYESLQNTILYTIFITLLCCLIGLFIALGLNQKFKGRDILRTLIFAPFLINWVVAGFIWTYIFDQHGILNTLMTGVGLDDFTRIWLGEPDLAKACIIVTAVWKQVGFCAVIFLANLQSIPGELIEVSMIDGASAYQRFKNVILPLMGPSMSVNVSLNFMWTMAIFDSIYVMTNGGPGYSTESLSTYIVKSMGVNQYGYAGSMGIVLSVIVIICSAVILKLFKSKEVEL